MAGKPEGRDSDTTGEFARNLVESGLFDSSDLLPHSVQLSAPSATEAARALVEAGKLTGYQADAVLEKRFNDLLIGNYEILDRLGAGGMGTVFKARHRRMKRIVALKVLSQEVASSGTFADRFQREVETIARLGHPNIVMAFDAGESEAGPFLVMEYVNGRDLASEVDKRGPLPAADAIDRILQAARGLEYAHGQGIVHRDIKPGNILRDGEGVVKVADLGLARLNKAEGGASANTSLTQAGMVVGTAEYMSPEQAIDSGDVDHRADIYSLGCTLHFLLAGRSPYQAGSIMSMLLKHRDAPIPDIHAFRPDIPPELAEVFQRMVAKAPEDRYQTMTEVVRILEQVLSRIHPSDAAPTGHRSSEPAGPACPVGVTMAVDPAVAGTAQHTGLFEPTAPSAMNTERVTGQTVILVEPSRTQAGIIRRYLQQLGIESIHLTGSGNEALELARRARSSVVVSSMHLSDMTGVELARTLLADAGCAGIGFVLATSEADTQAPGAIPNSPRVVLMPKPFDAAALARSIASVTA